MKILSNKKYNELIDKIEAMKEANDILSKANDRLSEANKLKDKENKKLTKEKEEEINIIHADKTNYESIITTKDIEISELKRQLDIANKEIEDLKKNVRKACSCKVESVLDKDTKKGKKEFKNTTKKVVKEETPKKKGRKSKNAK